MQFYSVGFTNTQLVFMYILLNKEREPIAYIENMMLLDASTKKVIGIIIGDCFFGKKEQVIGKIFNEHAYLVSGEIIAFVIRNPIYVSTSPTKEQMEVAWDILAGITKHTSDWIIEKNTWATISLLESLS